MISVLDTLDTLGVPTRRTTRTGGALIMRPPCRVRSHMRGHAVQIIGRITGGLAAFPNWLSTTDVSADTSSPLSYYPDPSA